MESSFTSLVINEPRLRRGSMNNYLWKISAAAPVIRRNHIHPVDIFDFHGLGLVPEHLFPPLLRTKPLLLCPL